METYKGHVRTPADAIILFEACRLGLLPRVQRRLSEKERQNIKSGSVFVWDEREAGMRRWTDGKSWSASRVSGSFLTYREMEGKRGGPNAFAPPVTMNAGRGGRSPNDSDSDGLDLEGPDGYRYKPDGLMKQSFSITTATHQKLHLISYYARSHPSSQNLVQPTTDPQLKHIRPVKGMYPESTVQEQQNVPAVTRAPMLSAIVHNAPVNPYMPRQSISHPVGFATQPVYASWPPSPVSTPPHAMNVHVPQYPHNSTYPAPPPSAGISPLSYHPPPFPPTSMDGSPRISLPQLDGLGLNSQPPSHRGSLASPMMQQHSPQTSQPQILSTPPLSLALPAPSSQREDRYSSPANSVHSRSPVQNESWDISPLQQPGQAGEAPPAGTPGLDVQDIPCEKLGFGEDIRALRVLDRAFAT